MKAKTSPHSPSTVGIVEGILGMLNDGKLANQYKKSGVNPYSLTKLPSPNSSSKIENVGESQGNLNDRELAD